MADSDSNPTALGSFLYNPHPSQFQVVTDSNYGDAYRVFSPGVLGEIILDSQGFRNADTPFQTHQGIVDAYLIHDSTYGLFYPSPRRGNKAFGQGLIMALDSDAQNATGGGEAGGGLTQYWIG